MNCKFCGEFINDGAAFCTNCGAKTDAVNEASVNNPVNEQESTENAQNFNKAYYNNYGNPAGSYSQQGMYSENQGYSQNNTYNQGSQPYWQPPINDKAASVKDYLKWMLLYPLWALIPGIGFFIYLVLCFKYAFDTGFKARANFFKATLITMAISVGIAAVIFILMFTVFGAFVATEFSTFEDMYPELYDEFMHGYNTLRICFGK